MIKYLLSAASIMILVGSAYGIGNRKPITPTTDFDFIPVSKSFTKKASIKAENEGTRNSIDFTLADEVTNALKLNNTAVGTEIYLAFEMSTENTVTFADDLITSINITTGVHIKNNEYKNSVNDITLFIIEEDQEKEPVYTQAAVLGDEGFTEYKIDLETPYKITAGKNFFVGYSFKIPNANQYYLATDYIYPETIDGCWIGTKKDDKIEWDNLAPEIGTLCIGCTITGENFPQDNVNLIYMSGTPYSEPGKVFNYVFEVKSKCINVSELDVECTIGNGDPFNYNIPLESTISYNEYMSSYIPLICNTEGTGLPLTLKITKVNGKDNKSNINVLSTTIDCYDSSKGFPKTHLIEEGTGTWCGWCPRGIVMMEYVTEHFPDLFNRVAIHKNGNKKDPMQVSTPLAVANKYMAGFPYAFVDRKQILTSMSTAEIDEFVSLYENIPAIAEISNLTATVSEEGKIDIESAVKFGMDFNNNNRFKIGYYITEDGLGPYSQTNYYSGGENGIMGGWEKKGSSVSTIYNDVARYLLGGVPGIANSIPAEIEAAVEYSNAAQIVTSDVTKEEFTLIAFIVDNSDGSILNSKSIKVENPYSAVTELEASNADIESRKYYNISGVEVKNPSNGIFIVTTVYSDGTVKNTKKIFK